MSRLLPIGGEHVALPVVGTPPFDADLLDRLLDEAGIDVLLATSKHNVQYLLGGYRCFFFDHKEAIGLSRYLPIVVYERGRPDRTAYVAAKLESFDAQLGRFWTPHVVTASWGSTDAIDLALPFLKAAAGARLRIGIEPSFLPYDAAALISRQVSACKLKDATFALERLRAVKSSDELDLLRTGSEMVVDAMREVFDAATPGITKDDLVERLRQAEVKRGLTFEYCLVTAGDSLNRAPSAQRLLPGDIYSLDSGGNLGGWVGDLCRMGVLGVPDAELVDLLGEIETIQQAARRPIRAGARGGDIFAEAMALVSRSANRDNLDFLAHGMGLVSHEAPRLTGQGPVPYSGFDAERGLSAGMVISIETALLHPRRGFIKLEDTVCVTQDGCEGFGDGARGWNQPA